jgi:hypothetical protein
MEQTQQTTKEYFKLLSIIHLALMVGLVLFGLVVSFFIADFQHPDNTSELARIIVYLVPGLCIAGLVASNMVSKNRVYQLKANSDLSAKLMGFREAMIIRFALLEGPGLFVLATIFITNDINYLIYAGVMVVLMLVKRPTMRSLIAELELDQKEIAFLENPDSIIK